MIKDYVDYLKDNPKGYWFKAKLYGCGWTPATWQGWSILLGYVALIGILSFIRKGNPSQEAGLYFILPVIILTAILISICYLKGEKPGWRWGKK